MKPIVDYASGNYEGESPRPLRLLTRYSVTFAATVLMTAILTNALLVRIAAADRGFGAIFIAGIVGPSVNFLLGITSLAFRQLVSRTTRASTALYCAAALSFFLAIPVDLCVIWSMDLQLD